MDGLTRIKIIHDRQQSKQDSKIKNFMEITGCNLDVLDSYLRSAYQGIRMSDMSSGEYIKKHFNEESYLIKAELRFKKHNKDMENGLTSGFGI